MCSNSETSQRFVLKQIEDEENAFAVRKVGGFSKSRLYFKMSLSQFYIITRLLFLLRLVTLFASENKKLVALFRPRIIFTNMAQTPAVCQWGVKILLEEEGLRSRLKTTIKLNISWP